MIRKCRCLRDTTDGVQYYEEGRIYVVDLEKHPCAKHFKPIGGRPYRVKSSDPYSLNDGRSDSEQAMLFKALSGYFSSFKDPNRRLNAIHNVVRKLREMAADCQMTICKTEDK